MYPLYQSLLFTFSDGTMVKKLIQNVLRISSYFRSFALKKGNGWLEYSAGHRQTTNFHSSPSVGLAVVDTIGCDAKCMSTLYMPKNR